MRDPGASLRASATVNVPSPAPKSAHVPARGGTASTSRRSASELSMDRAGSRSGEASADLPPHGDEAHRKEHLAPQLAAHVLLNEREPLHATFLSHRGDQPAPGDELVEERPAHVFDRGADEDRVERRRLGPAEVPVAMPDLDVA